MILRIFLGAVLMAVPVMTALAAENAMQVETAGGRSIIVQSVAGDTGRAEFDRAGRIIPLSKGVRLTEGDVLHTEGDKKVYLAVDNTTVLRLEENSEAAITRATFGQKLTVNLTKGRMFYNVAKQESGTESLELMSNNITIAIRGTSGILSVGNGRVQHQLYDGVVEVYEGDIKITQVPGQMVETRVGPAQTLLISTDVKNFTLKDIPASVAQEMLADENLMQRIVTALSGGDEAAAMEQLENGEVFEHILTNNTDEKVFKDTSDKKPAPAPTEPVTEAPTETTAETETETEPTQPTETSPTETEPTQPTETSPTETGPTQPTETSPTETSPTETEPTKPTETSPTETETETETETQTEPYVYCEYCQQTVDMNDPEATGHTICECGTPLCDKIPEHKVYIHRISTCPIEDGGCGKQYRPCVDKTHNHSDKMPNCENCGSSLRTCYNTDPEIQRRHTEVVNIECEYCHKILKTACMKNYRHAVSTCRTCGKEHAACCDCDGNPKESE